MPEISDKDFVKQLRLYFSSLSARSAKYLFLNLKGFEGSLVLSNGDYEMITAYVPAMLSFHVIKFKDPTFYDKFLKFLNFNLSQPYVIRIPQILKALKDNSFESLDVIYDDFKKMKLILVDKVVEDDTTSEFEEEIEDELPNDTSEDDEENPFKDTSVYKVVTFPSADICGQPIDNLYALTILEEYLQEIQSVKDTVEGTSDPHYFYDLTHEISYFHGNYFRLKLNLQDLLKDRYESVKDQISDYVYMVVIDGMDVPSTKEYLKKIPEFTIRFLVWSTNEKTIRYMALYEDSQVDIFSVRPFHQVVIPKLSS